MKTKELFKRTLLVLMALLGTLTASAAVEAYAVYKSLNKTLSFYYDDLRSTRTGLIYDLNAGENEPGWYSDGTYASVRHVVFDPSFAGARPTTTYAWFADMASLQAIAGANYLNTSEVTNMMGMFSGCTSMTTLDLAGWNTAKVTDMGYMFGECGSLTTIYVGDGWSTAAVTSPFDMFLNCTSLVGGMGTTYNANHTDASYAHVDGGPSKPGYLTDINDPYAELSADGTTLTFYKDGLRSIRTGTTYALNEVYYYGDYVLGDYVPSWYFDRANITNVVFDASFADARPTTTQSWFGSMENLQSITGMEYLNTSEVTNMRAMFYNCIGLTSLDVSNFNTSKVTSMYGMFAGCSGLTSLDVSGFNTANVTNMYCMFLSCSSLTSLDLTSFNTANVTNMYCMFLSCSSLTSLDLTSFNTANVTDMSYMFGSCSRLTSLDVSSFNTENVTNMTCMFWSCSGLTNLDVSHFNTSNVTYTDDMFSGCSGLTSLDVSHFNTSNVNYMSYMFFDCSGLTSLDLSSFNTAKVLDMRYMFCDCDNLAAIIVGSGWSTAAVTSSTDMFYNCISLVGGQGTTYNASNPKDKTYAHIDGGTSNPGYFTDVKAIMPYACYTEDNTTLTFYYDYLRRSRPGTTYDMNTGNDKPDWYTDNSYRNVSTVVFDASFADALPTSTYWWFSDMGNLTSIEGIEYLNTNEVTNMSRMFSTCWSMESFDLSHFDTRNVTDMSSMFNYCEALTSLDLSSFDTGNVTNMDYMFYECSSLSSLDLSSFNTENVMSFKEMFFDCAGLNSMDLRNFDTRNAESMNGMFLECSELTSLDLSSFNTANVTDMSYMFDFCRNLETIYVGDEWSTAAVTNSSGMFSDCLSIVGGKGTTYDANHIDKAYAHVDGGTSNPGYFTAKAAFLRGDVNDDGQVKISDVTALINYLLSGDASAINLDAADCNQDGQVKISDVTTLINYLLSGTW